MVTFIRSFVTVGLFLAFIGICLWAYSPRRRQQFADAARLPFDEGEKVEGVDEEKAP